MKFPYRRILNNICRHPAISTQEAELIPSPTPWRVGGLNVSRRMKYGKEKKPVTFQWRSLTDNTLTRWPRWTLLATCGFQFPPIWCDQSTLHFHGILSKNPSPHSNHTWPNHIGGHSTKYQISTPQNCQGYKKTRGGWDTVTDQRRLRRHGN